MKAYANDASDLDVLVSIDISKSKVDLDDAHDYREWLGGQVRIALDSVMGSVYKVDVTPDLLSSPQEEYSHYLFLPSLGTEVQSYREASIAEMEKYGQRGERKWRELMKRLWAYENEGMPKSLASKRKNLYPQSLSAARSYFLRKGQKNDDLREEG